MTILLIVAFYLSSVACQQFYPWKDRWKYYFPDIQTKLREIFIGDCINSYSLSFNSSVALPDDASLLQVTVLPIDKDMLKWWKGFEKPRQMRVDPFLCDVVATKRLPIFNNTGCQLASYMNPSAPRCQTKYLKWICDHARIDIYSPIANNFFIPEADHQTTDLPPQPWIITARDAFLSLCGQISAQCGVVHTTANCMATGYRSQAELFRNSCPIKLAQEFANGATSIQCQGAPFGSTIEYYEKVFVVAEVDDSYVYHIHLEIMPRIVYHLDLLKTDPSIRILIGCDTKKKASETESGLKHMLLSIKPLMELVGLDMSRFIVHKHVFAKEVYLPMEGGCQDPVYNTWQILHMRKLFFQQLQISDSDRDDELRSGPHAVVGEGDVVTAAAGRAGVGPASSGGSLQQERVGGEQLVPSSVDMGEMNRRKRPIMLLLKRSSHTLHTRNGHDSVRQWSDAFTEVLLSSLRATFPMYEIKLFSDKNTTLMGCYGCQIAAFAEAKVLIGVHGAGLGNILYMRPNSAVVEFAPYGNDGRCLLGGGPFSRLAAVMSHNYMMHHPPYEEFKWNKDLTSEFNVTRFSDADEQLVLHIEFNQTVRINTIVFGVPSDETCPREVKLFLNRNNLGFQEAADLPALQTIELVPSSGTPGVVSINLQQSKWSRVESITMFIADNHGGAISSLHSLKIFGTLVDGVRNAKLPTDMHG